ncbi:hypothetical protein YC2023_063231 [Brassica napus]
MSKPYGRFHVLPDFDEGKRSCWRKLERHNNIRKRKPVDKGGVASKQQKVNSGLTIIKSLFSREIETTKVPNFFDHHHILVHEATLH